MIERQRIEELEGEVEELRSQLEGCGAAELRSHIIDPDLFATRTPPEQAGIIPPHYVQSHVHRLVHSLEVGSIVQMCSPEGTMDGLRYKVGRVTSVSSSEEILSTVEVEFLCCSPGKPVKDDNRSRLLAGESRKSLRFAVADPHRLSMLKLLSCRGNELSELTHWERMDTMACLLADLCTTSSVWEGISSPQLETVLCPHQLETVRTLSGFQRCASSIVETKSIKHIHPDRASQYIAYAVQCRKWLSNDRAAAIVGAYTDIFQSNQCKLRKRHDDAVLRKRRKTFFPNGTIF